MRHSALDLDLRSWLCEVVNGVKPVEQLDPNAFRAMTQHSAAEVLREHFAAHRSGVVPFDYVWGRAIKAEVDLNPGHEHEAIEGTRFDLLHGDGAMSKCIEKARNYSRHLTLVKS